MSFLIGSTIEAKSFLSFIINALLELVFATDSSNETSSSRSSNNGLLNADQAAFLPSRTCFLMSFYIAESSSSVAMLLEITHSRIFTLQSKSASQAKRSAFL